MRNGRISKVQGSLHRFKDDVDLFDVIIADLFDVSIERYKDGVSAVRGIDLVSGKPFCLYSHFVEEYNRGIPVLFKQQAIRCMHDTMDCRFERHGKRKSGSHMDSDF
eukprot:463355_1